MLRTTLLSAVAAVTFGAALALSHTPADAQVGVEIGPGGPRVYDRSPPPYYERRRRAYDEDDCHWEVRRRVNRYGETVERRMRVCD